MEDIQAIPIAAKKRPLGVWILTIWNGLAVGLIPLALALFIVFSGWTGESSGSTLLALFPSILLTLFVIFAALFAWRGNNLARYALLMGIAIYYGGLIYNNITAYGLDIMNAEQARLAAPRILRSLMWIIINFSYFFLNKNARKFYSNPE